MIKRIEQISFCVREKLTKIYHKHISATESIAQDKRKMDNLQNNMLFLCMFAESARILLLMMTINKAILPVFKFMGHFMVHGYT